MRSPTVRERFLEAGRSRLYVREIGAGPPIVVVHGGPDFDHEYLLPELDLLAGRFRLTYYDQRGRGRSFSGERAADITVASEMDDLDQVRASAGTEAVALLGHSFGALLAVEYAIRQPGRVSHLLLVNPAPVSHAGMLALRAELTRRRGPDGVARMRELAAEPAYVRGDAAVEAAYYRIHFGVTLDDPDQLDAVVGRLRRSFSPAGIVAAREIEASLYAQTWDREDYDRLPALGALTIPTLVVAGDRDLVPLPVIRELAAAIRGARLVVLDPCGHFAYLERPAAFGALVRDLILGSDVR
jgi:proline iminopeptidase